MTVEGKGREEDRGGEVGAFGIFRAGPWSAIPHYYGTFVRQLLIAGAAFMLVAAPLYADDLRLEFPFELAGALVAVALAAFTNPHGRAVMFGDAIASGVGVVAYAGWGLMEYDTINPVAFVLRLVIAIVFLFAFYFSLKTLRAFALGQVGRREPLDEFETPQERAEDETLESDG